MYICLKCGNSNSAEANYCIKCNALLPKIGADQVTSATRGSVKFDNEELKIFYSGLYTGLKQILTLYSEKTISLKTLLKGLDESCDWISDIIEEQEERVKTLEKINHLPKKLKDIMATAHLDMLEGLDMMLEVYEKAIGNLHISGKISLEKILASAGKADSILIKGKDALIKVIRDPAAEELLGEKSDMEDLFYKKKTSMPEDLYGGEHISFDIL